MEDNRSDQKDFPSDKLNKAQYLDDSFIIDEELNGFNRDHKATQTLEKGPATDLEAFVNAARSKSKLCVELVVSRAGFKIQMTKSIRSRQEIVTKSLDLLAPSSASSRALQTEVYAMHEDNCWDILLSAWAHRYAHAAAAFSARLAGPTRAACSPTVPRSGPTTCSTRCSNGGTTVRPGEMAGALWQSRVGTWARLLPGDEPAQPLRGGGMWINILAPWPMAREEPDAPRILLPCR